MHAYKYLLGHRIQLIVQGLGVILKFPGLESGLQEILQITQTGLHIICGRLNGVANEFAIAPSGQAAADLLDVSCNGKGCRSLGAQGASQTEQMRSALCVVRFVT